MTLHHVMVCLIGFLSSFTSYGWRYYAPFFFGVIETSSVPLSLLNAFKVRSDWVEAMPVLHLLRQVSFSLTFIGARVFLWISNMFLFLKDTRNVIASSDESIGNTTRVMTLIAGDVPGVFLTALQLFWTWKILTTVAEIVRGKSSGTKKAA